MTVAVREARPGDEPAIRIVHERAFGRALEADLVDALRRGCPDRLSLVALSDAEVVGHVLFTPVRIDTGGRRLVGMGLAPLAVLPDFQRRGIGARLVERGLDRLARGACPFVVVLGDPGYYRRFGFAPAARHGIASEFPGMPDEAFQIAVFDAAALAGVTGVARYRPEFASAGDAPPPD